MRICLFLTHTLTGPTNIFRATSSIECQKIPSELVLQISTNQVFFKTILSEHSMPPFGQFRIFLGQFSVFWANFLRPL